MDWLCRDCLNSGTAATEPRRCPQCGSPRIRSHAELFALSIAHVDCDAFYASVEKRDDPSLRDRPLPEKTIAFGEVGLSGEIRPVPNGEERLREAATHGFKRAIVPRANAPKKRVGDMEVVPVDRLSEAIAAVE